MDWDGKIAAPTLRCAATGAALQPGETIYSALTLHEGVFARLDYHASAWPTVDHAAIGILSWWRRTLPRDDGRPRALKLDAAVLSQLFADLVAARDRPSQCFCYIIALCLVRIRRLRLQGIEERPDGSWLLLVERGTQHVSRLRDPRMDRQEEEQVRANLMRVIALEEGPTQPTPTGPAPTAD